MHEAGIVQEMLVTAERSARGAGCGTITRIVLRVGVFSSAVPEALEFAFEVLRAETPAANARLEVEWVPVTCHCATCDRSFQPEGMVFRCPDCGGLSADIRAGRELAMVSMEVS